MTQHVDYPHWPGRLYDCPACEEKCHCTPAVLRGEETECIYTGTHLVRVDPARNPEQEGV